MGVDAMLEGLDLVKAGVIIKHDQRLEDGSYESWFGKDEAEIDWAKPVADVYNTIRAANPAPGAWTTLNGSELKVYDSAIVTGDGAFGEVVSIDGSGVTVQGNCGRILIKRVRPESGGKITASEWAASAEVNPGTKLGSKL